MMDTSLSWQSGKARLTSFWIGVASVMFVSAPAQVVAQDNLPRGANPTPNQLVAYCETEWNRATDNGYWDVTGSYFIYDALKASSEGLRSGSWLTEHRRASLKNHSQAFADCLSRGVLAGRNGTFRTPSMIVRGRIDGDTRGRQDPIDSGRPTIGGAEGGNDSERLARENREREKAHRDNVRRHEEDVRRNKAAQDEAQRVRHAEDARRIRVERQGRAKERAAIEAKVKAAILQSGAVIHSVDEKTCWVTYTNRTAYWVTVEAFYTISWQTPGSVAQSSGHEDVMEISPGLSQAFPVWAVLCERDEWKILGGSIKVKDNINNYPFYLR